MKRNMLDLREAIVEKAVAIAERSNWEAVRLFDVAAELEISLEDVRRHFREKEDLVDAWFDRADSQMLKTAETVEFLALTPRERLNHLIMAWLDTSAEHRRVIRQMIGAKLEPGHLHIQIPAIMRISRTVQWMREAAHRDATFLRRALEETALTAIYLATFTFWMRDASENSYRTRDFLAQALRRAESLDRRVYGSPSQPVSADATTEPPSAREFPTVVTTSAHEESLTHSMHVKSG